MASRKEIRPSAAWFRIEAREDDWRGRDAAELRRWYQQMVLIRRFEEQILDLSLGGLIHGPAHASIGQEAAAVGAMSMLATADRINGTHRAHHQVLSKLVNAATPTGFDPGAHSVPDEVAAAVRLLMAEIMGLAEGYCGGRGGSMHMRYDAAGIPGTSAIVGGNLPHATGYALADRLMARDRVSVAFFGDGATMAGATYEAMNIAALYRLPVIFFAENNGYAVSTKVEEQTRETRLASRGPMLGFPGIECDGMDVLAVHLAMAEARRIIAEEGGPVVVEAQCYRFMHQMGGRPGSEFGYRTREEEQAWRRRDPVEAAAARLKALGAADDALLARLDGEAAALVRQAADALTESTGEAANARRIPQRLWPDKATVDDGIIGDLSELAGERTLELADVSAENRETVKFIHAASEVIQRRMAEDPTIIVMGEDVHRLRGGVSGALRDASDRWPERLLAMPIAENGFTGVALGAALAGMRPVVEIMFGDFCLVAADQLFNSVGKIRHMFGDGFPVPLVVRVRVSPLSGYGSQHSSDPSGLFALFPGWRIMSPSTPFDYVGMMNAALKCNDPVVVIEHVQLFQEEGPLPVADRDYILPIGRARVARTGSACTLLATSVMVKAACEAAQEAGVDAEVIDLRFLDEASLDWETIAASVRKTNRVAVVEQVSAGLSLGGRIAGQIQARLFDHLDHEVLTVTGARSAPVVSAPLNRAALAGKDDVVSLLARLVPPARAAGGA
ncbi:MAG: MFS transporter [Rhizobiaceae bacterium]|nr:MFS transporter [Rhizobiaceae bacterium]